MLYADLVTLKKGMPPIQNTYLCNNNFVQVRSSVHAVGDGKANFWGGSAYWMLWGHNMHFITIQTLNPCCQ